MGAGALGDVLHQHIPDGSLKSSFAAPFAAGLHACRYEFGWDWRAAEIGGIALSTTSLAVVYAVLAETGLTATRIHKLIMSATFVTDLGTVIALSVLFLRPTWWLAPFARWL